MGTVLTQQTVGAADYSFQVSTFNVNMAFYLTSPSHYRILFTTIATLTDNKTNKAVSTAVCVNQPDETASSATYEEMLANDGERAKRELAAGVDFCVQKLQRDMFTI